MLRTQPPEVYDAWVSNEMGFGDPRVVNAIDEFGYFARNDDYVAGGGGAVASIDFRDSPAGMFASPPQCYMHRQASFIPSFFPEGVVIGEDADFFYFPAYESMDLGTARARSRHIVRHHQGFRRRKSVHGIPQIADRP